MLDIRGIARSGTNFVTWMIIHNLHDPVVFYGFKHIDKNFDTDLEEAIIRALGKKDGVLRLYGQLDQMQSDIKHNNVKRLAIIKNPYALVVSWKRWRKNRSIEYLITTWNNKGKDWLHTTDTLLIKYENMLQDPYNTLSKISEFSGYQMKDKIVKQKNVFDKALSVEKRIFDPEYYIQEKYVKNLSEVEINEISSCLDIELMHKLGYSMIPSGG